MECVLNSVLICGVRTMERKDKPTLYFVDWYSKGACSSIIDEDKVESYKKLEGRFVAMQIDVIEGRNGILYKILQVQPHQAKAGQSA